MIPSSVLLMIASSDEETIAASRASASTPRCESAPFANTRLRKEKTPEPCSAPNKDILSEDTAFTGGAPTMSPVRLRMQQDLSCRVADDAIVWPLAKARLPGHQTHWFASPGITPSRCGRTTQNRWPVGASITHQVFTFSSRFAPSASNRATSASTSSASMSR